MVFAKRSLGQNFLVDSGIIEQILSASGVTDQDDVIEIGPGRGALTAGLAMRARQFVAIEKDDTLAAEMAERLASFPSARLLHLDALHMEPSALPHQGPWKVVANLPYNIAGRLILKLLEWGPGRISQLTVMLQREVALRFTAREGSRDYGVISVLAWARAEAWHLFPVPPTAFRPRPRVESSIVRFRLRPTPRVDAAAMPGLEKVLKAGFSARRKTLLNSLRRHLSRDFRDPRAELTAVLEGVGIDPGARAEHVSPERWVALASALGEG